MTTYITQPDKNGKELCYRVTDGKKKNISRAEYEANTAEIQTVEAVAEPQTETAAVEFFTLETESPAQSGEIIYEAEPIPTVEKSALNIVQKIIYATGDPHKLSLKTSGKFALILYRGCSILGLMYGDNKAISKISFMGTTTGKRNRPTRYDFSGLADIESRREQILEQVGFVNNSLNAARV